jgi:hypothetical protein
MNDEAFEDSRKGQLYFESITGIGNKWQKIRLGRHRPSGNGLW